MINDIVTWLTDLMAVLGGPGAGLAIALENIFPPIPSELILPLAGFTAAQGRVSVVEMIIWTTIGSVVGALVLYLVGKALGRERMRAILGKVPLVDVSDLDKTEAWFQRHGNATVFFGRMIPMFRSFISIPAGIERMPMPRFILLTAAGSGIWNTIFVLAGYWLGARWHEVEGWVSRFQYVVIAVVVVAVVYWVVRRIWEIRAGHRVP